MRRSLLSGSVRAAAIAAICGAMLGTVPLVAQDGPPPPPQGGSAEGRPDPAQMQARRLQMMTKQLHLTPDQVTQIQAIDTDSTTQMRALRDDTTTAPADKHAKMMEIRKASNEKTRAVLNDDQKAKFDAMQARRHERHNPDGGADGPPPPPPTQQ